MEFPVGGGGKAGKGISEQSQRLNNGPEGSPGAVLAGVAKAANPSLKQKLRSLLRALPPSVASHCGALRRAATAHLSHSSFLTGFQRDLPWWESLTAAAAFSPPFCCFLSAEDCKYCCKVERQNRLPRLRQILPRPASRALCKS